MENIDAQWRARIDAAAEYKPKTKKPYKPPTGEMPKFVPPENITIPNDCVYMADCVSCGWFGMREDCLRGMCPNCGDRVVKTKVIGGLA
jgi:hypothetical protein